MLTLIIGLLIGFIIGADNVSRENKDTNMMSVSEMHGSSTMSMDDMMTSINRDLEGKTVMNSTKHSSRG